VHQATNHLVSVSDAQKKVSGFSFHSVPLIVTLSRLVIGASGELYDEGVRYVIKGSLFHQANEKYTGLNIVRCV